MTPTRQGSGCRQRQPLVRVAVIAAAASLAAACGTTADAPSAPKRDDGLAKGWTNGITDTEVRIGLVHIGEGKGNVTDEPDPSESYVAQLRAVIDDVNANGGVGGRKIVPVWHRTQADAASGDAEAQSLCSDFTQDRPVFISGYARDDLAQQCFAAKGVPQVDPEADEIAQSNFDNDPYLVTTPILNTTRLMRVQVDSLIANDFFQPNAKIGFFVTDTQGNLEAGEKGLKPALAKHRLSVAEEFRMSNLETQEDVAKLLAQVDNAVLKFRDTGITHVIFLGASPAFMLSAEKQNYRPHYAISTWDWPVSLPDNGVVPAQLLNAAGIGYFPAKDVVDYKTAGDSPVRQHCLDVMAKKDIRPESGSDEAQLLYYCDQIYLIKQALEAAAKPVTGDTFMQAIHQLGKSFKPASTWRAIYSKDRRDGVAVVRYLKFTSDCSCFRYEGGDINVE